ncbi:MAG TPA: hypothetical protein VF407_14605, partial [Polyangiaceae bacterium]
MRSTTVLALATATFVASVAACSTSESTDAPAGPTQIVGETTSFEACPAAGPSGVTLLRCEATTATARIALGLCG